MINKLKKNNNINWIGIIAIVIFSLVIISIVFYKLGNKEGFSSAPKFKKSKNNKKKKKEKNKNPLSHFGFKYDKSENFNDNNDPFANAMDEADRLDVNSLSVSNMKSVLHNYNNNITKKLKKATDDNTIVSVVNQGRVMLEEFKNLFDLNLII